MSRNLPPLRKRNVAPQAKPEGGIQSLNDRRYPSEKNISLASLCPLRRFLARFRFTRPVSRHRLIFYVLVSCVCVLHPLQMTFLGRNQIQGGWLGDMVDKRMHRSFVRQARTNRLTRLQQHRIVLSDSEMILNTDYTSFTSEVLMRRARRREALEAIQYTDDSRQAQCKDSERRPTGGWSIPNHILQPDYGLSYRSPREVEGLISVPFGEFDMRQHIREKFPSLLSLYDVSSPKARVLLWTVCAVYTFGGYVFGGTVADAGSLVSDSLSLVDDTRCADLVMAVVEATSTGGSTPSELLVLGASPGHPHLQCVIHHLQEIVSEYLEVSTVLSIFLSAGESENATTNGRWGVFRPEKSTCSFKLIDQVDSISDQRSSDPTSFVKVVETKEVLRGGAGPSSLSPRVEVKVSDRYRTPAQLTPKLSIREKLNTAGCQSGWMCNRCLNSAWYGTYESCSSVCRECFASTICKPSEKHEVVIDVDVRETRPLVQDERLIPKIIHQTWSEELTPDRYPQLVRIQNSWKAAGWEYRFYTDSDARGYIQEHFPDRFLDAFDTLVPGVFKADLFRYLVLLREGGIYADADVLLNANLEDFLTPSMSFFAPRDLVGADHEAEFCLWNGLIGAAPGHPFLVKVVEQVMNRVRGRFDAYDMEQELCHWDGNKAEVWKLRQWATLFLSGPCALGMAVNKSIGNRTVLEKFNLGWAPPSVHHHGRYSDNALFLSSDKKDLSAFRFSDLDRNTIIASTDYIDLTKTPLEGTDHGRLRHGVYSKKVHFSQTEFLDEIFGSKGVYADDNVANNEILKLVISYTKP